MKPPSATPLTFLPFKKNNLPGSGARWWYPSARGTGTSQRLPDDTVNIHLESPVIINTLVRVGTLLTASSGWECSLGVQGTFRHYVRPGFTINPRPQPRVRTQLRSGLACGSHVRPEVTGHHDLCHEVDYGRGGLFGFQFGKYVTLVVGFAGRFASDETEATTATRQT